MKIQIAAAATLASLASLSLSAGQDPPPLTSRSNWAIPISGNVPGIPDGSIPTSNSNIYTIPKEDVRIWSGHLGDECTPKELSRVLADVTLRAFASSSDGSTVAYLTTSGVAFSRASGPLKQRAFLEVPDSIEGRGIQPSFTLSPRGRWAAFMTTEGFGAMPRQTLWTLDLRRMTPELSRLVPRRIKRAAAGKVLTGFNWTPDGDSFLFVETVQVRSKPVSVLIRYDLKDQQEHELRRHFGQIDVFFPVSSGSSSSAYRVLLGTQQGLTWISPSGRPDVAIPELTSFGLQLLAASAPVGNAPPDVAVFYPHALGDNSGAFRVGTYRLAIAGGPATTVSRGREVRGLSYSPQGLLTLTRTDLVGLLVDKELVGFELQDENRRPRPPRSSAWHAKRPWLAVAYRDELVVLDLSGKLPHRGIKSESWKTFADGCRPGTDAEEKCPVATMRPRRSLAGGRSSG
ncbi:MAG: hypothetical protein JKY65_15385, partial [Planctomycetes bacterium]|nr:hypothetical protein [Planctomycetota bacterium]